MVALGYKYCREIPRLFEFLSQEVAQSGDDKTQVDESYRWLDRRFKSYWVSGAILVITAALNGI